MKREGKTPSLASVTCLALMRIGTRMAVGFDRRYQAYELTQAQFRLLLGVVELGGQEGISPSELADTLLIERATVSVMAQKLVERGLLARLPGPNRRTHRLVLTQTGGNHLHNMGAQATVLAEETLAPLTPAEQQTLHALLARLEAHLRVAYTHTSDTTPEGKKQ